MKLLYFNDPHNSEQPPVSRDLNYHTDILKKQLEIIKIAHELKVDYIGCSGDWFHRKSNATIREGLTLVRLMKKSKIPFIGIGGNHDFVGYNQTTIQNRPLGILVESGVLRLLDNNPIIQGDVVLTGTSHYAGYDVDRLAYIKPDAWKNKYTIALTHGSLILSNTGTFYGHYTNMNMLKSMDGDLHNVIFNGHFHNNQGSFKLKEKNSIVFNIGSIARNVLMDDIAKRIPTVMFINVKDGECKFEQIELTNVRDYQDCFISNDIIKNDTNEIKEFVAALIKESGELSILHDKELIKTIVKKHKFNSTVEKMVLDYIEQ